MIRKPKYGWTNVMLDDKSKFRASYLTDVPMDLLEAFTSALQSDGKATCFFDAEGWEFTLNASNSGSEIKVEDEELYDESFKEDQDIPASLKSEKTTLILAKELVTDIESNLQDWIEWSYDWNDIEESEQEKRADAMRDKLEILKIIVNKKS